MLHHESYSRNMDGTRTSDETAVGDALQVVPAALDRLAENDLQAPALLDHADYIRCLAGQAANRWLYYGVPVVNSYEARRRWKRMTYAIACFGNLKLAETTDSVEAMDVGERRMMACAAAIQEAKR